MKSPKATLLANDLIALGRIANSKAAPAFNEDTLATIHVKKKGAEVVLEATNGYALAQVRRYLNPENPDDRGFDILICANQFRGKIRKNQVLFLTNLTDRALEVEIWDPKEHYVTNTVLTLLDKREKGHPERSAYPSFENFLKLPDVAYPHCPLLDPARAKMLIQTVQETFPTCDMRLTLGGYGSPVHVTAENSANEEVHALLMPKGEGTRGRDVRREYEELAGELEDARSAWRLKKARKAAERDRERSLVES